MTLALHHHLPDGDRARDYARDHGAAVPAPRLRAVPDLPPARPHRVRAQRTEAAVAPPAVAVLRPPAGRDTAAPVRLTRRGCVVVALSVALLGAGLVWLAALSAPGGGTAATRVPAAVTVHSGDTVWAIATRYAGSRDPRAVVAGIQRLNHLDGAGLTPGQVLRLR